MVADAKSLSRWAPITGRWKVDGDGATYLGPDSSDVSPTYGVLLSDGKMTDGLMRTSVKLLQNAEAGRILLGYRSSSFRYVTVGLGGYGQAYVISEFVPQAGWGRIEGLGSRSNLEIGREYQIEVYINGQRIQLLVDGIRVLDHIMSEPLVGDQVGLFAWGRGEVSFGPVEITTEIPSAFVAMPFSEPFTHLYDDVIKPVATEWGIRAHAVSEVYRPGVILEDIRQGIAEAKVVIVEITSDNPNVYYALGYAHGLSKPTVLLADRGKELPFDISSYRVIFYDNSIHGKSDVEDQLRRHLTAILRD